MDEILKTTLLEFEKSSFIIDIVQHASEKKYLSITQITKRDDHNTIENKIKFNPDQLLHIWATLQKYYLEIKGVPPPKASKNIAKNLLLNKHDKIQKRYLKGVSINDLMLQFDCKEEYIRQVLRNAGIALPEDIASPEPFKPKFKRRN